MIMLFAAELWHRIAIAGLISPFLGGIADGRYSNTNSRIGATTSILLPILRKITHELVRFTNVADRLHIVYMTKKRLSIEALSR